VRLQHALLYLRSFDTRGRPPLRADCGCLPDHSCTPAFRFTAAPFSQCLLAMPLCRGFSFTVPHPKPDNPFPPRFSIYTTLGIGVPPEVDAIQGYPFLDPGPHGLSGSDCSAFLSSDILFPPQQRCGPPPPFVPCVACPGWESFFEPCSVSGYRSENCSQSEGRYGS